MGPGSRAVERATLTFQHPGPNCFKFISTPVVPDEAAATMRAIVSCFDHGCCPEMGVVLEASCVGICRKPGIWGTPGKPTEALY